MTYPVFLYNMLLAATYVVLAVVFFWLHRSRSSRLAWWLMILFACSFVDNGTYFMKEVFTALGHPDPLFATFYQAAEALFIACYPFIIRMISGCFYDDMPSNRSMVVLGAACAVATALGVAAPVVPYSVFGTVYPLLYAWVFLRLIPKMDGVWPKAVVVSLVVLHVIDATCRVLGVEAVLFWENRDLLVETCWAIYVGCAVYIAWTLLHTVEQPYLPNVDMSFRRFLDAYGLSGREGEIVKLLMEGETNQGICNKLYIAAGTVKAHNHSIYKKLGIENRSQVLLKYTDYLERSAQEARLFC